MKLYKSSKKLRIWDLFYDPLLDFSAMPFYYVKVPKSKNELTYVQVGQKRPFTQKIRSLAQKMAILVF